VIQRGLDTPWEIAFIDATRYLVTERTGRLSLGRLSGGPLTRVKADLTDLASGDSGLMDW
jgi:glucose/arabinose dehydrogenase